LQEVDDSPVSFELEPIYSESQFDRVIAEAQQLEESVIIVWCVVLVCLWVLFELVRLCFS
jgi:thioredoxin 1